jgi:hypothetical protein
VSGQFVVIKIGRTSESQPVVSCTKFGECSIRHDATLMEDDDAVSQSFGFI